MKWWPNRVFAFLLALTEVNVSLVMVEFCGNDPTSQIEFRTKLADVLINNKNFNEEDDKTPVKRQRNNEHQFIPTACSPKGKIHDGQMAKAKSAYPQHKCTSCTCCTHGYCKCSPGIYRCNECYMLHLIGVENNLSSPC